MSSFSNQIFARDVDHTGTNLTVHFTTYDTAPVELVGAFLKHWGQLIEDGHAVSNYIPSLQKARFVYIVIDDKLVAFIAWEWATNNISHIIYAGVEPDYRQRGLYKLLHKYYEKRLKEGGLTLSSIISRTSLSVNNSIVVGAAQSNGYTLEYMRMVKRIK